LLKQKTGGYKVVLTSDRTLMSEYAGGIFLGFSACIPRGLIPDSFYFSIFCPSVPINEDGSAKFAPCGIRKMEALLLNNGFTRDEVIVAHPDCLDKVVGENTKVLGVNETDPLGIGPATSTFTQLFNLEKAYMAVKFEEILNNPAVQKYKPKIIMGGPGAWQLEDTQARHKLGVDCVVVGEGEKVAKDLFDNAAQGLPLPEVVYGPVVENEADIPTIQGPTIDGIIEISRGCGRGCAFCVPTLQRYRCFSIEHILREVEVNIREGRRPLLHAEDVLRYKAKGFEVNEEAVKELFGRVAHHPGVDAVGLSHFALSSVASAPNLIHDLSEVIGVKRDGDWMSGQCGIETGSPRLIGELMAGKAKPFDPEEWPEVVVKAFKLLNDSNWVPCATLIIGLPGEKEEDVQMTLDLVNRLHDYKSLLVPLFMVSEGGLKDKSQSFKIANITHKQSELFLTCWKHNLGWGKEFLDEYFVTKAHWGKGHVMKMVFSYGIKQAEKLMETCKTQYDYDLPLMLADAKNGKFPLSKPLKVITKVGSIGRLKPHQEAA
jgi:radical SAM superfamily enzyme YgiQ (UPF0313 family)